MSINPDLLNQHFQRWAQGCILQSSPGAVDVHVVGGEGAGPACGFPATPEYLGLPPSALLAWSLLRAEHS